MLDVKISINRLFIFILFSLCLFISSFKSYSEELPPSANPEFWQLLTPQERQYLKETPLLTVQNNKDYAPINYRSNNKPVGYSIDYLTLISDVTGLKFSYVYGNSWSQYIDMLKNEQIDLIINITKTEDREFHFNFSQSILKKSLAIIVNSRVENKLDKLLKLKGKEVSTIQGNKITQFLKDKYPSINQVNVESVSKGLISVANNEVDAFVTSNVVANYIIEQLQLTNLKSYLITPYSTDTFIAVNNKNDILIKIIDKAIRFIPEYKKNNLRANWFGITEEKKREDILSQLSMQELTYLKEHPILRVQSEVDFPPFNYISEGKSVGISIDYITLIANKLGLELDIVKGKTWSEYIEMLKSNVLDVMLNILETPDRAVLFNFTQPYVEVNFVSVTRKNESYIVNALNDHKEHKIVVIKGFGFNKRINKVFPENPIIEVNNGTEAFELLASGKADVHFSVENDSSYRITEGYMNSLRISPLPKEFSIQSIKLSLATNKTNLLLTSILNKAVNSMSSAELVALKKNWIVESVPVKSKVELSDKELAYLANKKVLKVNIKEDFSPFNYIENGEYKGFSIDVIEKVSEILNVKLTYSYDKFYDEFRQLNENSYDILLDTMDSGKDNKRAHYTLPYFESRNVLITHKDNATNFDIASLNNKNLGVKKNSAFSKVFKQKYPEIKYYYVASIKDGLLAVSEKKIAAFIAPEAVADHLLEKYLIKNLTFSPISEVEVIKKSSHSMATSLDNKILRNIIDKAMFAIAEEDFIALRRKWFNKSQFDNDQKSKITKEQILWLRENEKLKVLLPTLGLPLGEIKNGKYQGMIADFLSLIEQKTSISWVKGDFENKDNHNILEPAELIVANKINKNLKKDYIFSDPFFTMYVVLVSSNKQSISVEELSNLQGKTVGIVKDASYLLYTQNNYPNLKVKSFDAMPQAILSVNKGEIDLLLCPLVHCSYLMDEMGINNLKITGQVEFQDSLSFAVHKDYPQLLDIINLVISEITPLENNSIFKKWNRREDLLIKTDYSLLWQLVIVVLIIFSLTVAWNRKIASFAASVAKSNTQLAKTKRKVQALLDCSGQGFLYFGQTLIVRSEYSAQCKQIFLTDPAGKCITDLLFSDDLLAKQNNQKILQRALAEEDDFKRDLIVSLLPKDIEIHDKKVYLDFQMQENHKVMLILTDKTEQFQLQKEAREDQKKLQLVLAVVNDKTLFFETLDAFEKLLFNLDQSDYTDTKENLINLILVAELHREIHTFKSLFSQFFLHNISDTLHQIEETFSLLLTNDEATSHNTIRRLLCLSEIKIRLKIDLDMLLDILGDSFFSMKNYMSVEKSLVEKIESLTVNLVSNKNISGEILPLIYVCQQLSKVDFKQLILCHRSSIQGLAKRFDKSIKPLAVIGDSVFVSEKNINNLNRVLVHVFRNCISHGIETKEQRELQNKVKLAQIICSVSSNDNYLQLEISDDGQGINLDKVVEKSIALNLISKEEVAATCKNKLLQFIFSDQLSTTQSINQLSGRGMGLSAVKAEVEALGGIVTVYSEENVGTRFMFSLPLEKVR